jgi:hypothetical protein
MESPVESGRRRLRSPLVLPEGIEAGLVGALGVAGVYFARDLWMGDPVHTPALLGTLLLSGAEAARSQSLAAGAAPLYHTLHFLAWIALGFAGSALMGYAERARVRWLPAVAAIAALVPLGVLDVLVRNAQIERLHLWVGGLVGIAAMGGFLVWRHPGAVGDGGSVA